MGEQITQKYCPQCQRNIAASRPGINHLLHLILTLVTCGTWGIVWLILLLVGGGTYRCGFCGGTQLLPAQPGQLPGSGYGPPR